MKIKDIEKILGTTNLTPELSDDTVINTACGSDMMSDVLAYVKNQAVLVTGLNNPQVVRTADMMDMLCIVFVRGKTPDEQTLTLARERGIVILSTPLPMFTSCGLLYEAGLKGGGSVRG